MSYPNKIFHTQSNTRNVMHIRPIDSYACSTILENTMNVCSLRVYVVDELSHNGQPDTINLIEMKSPMAR